MLVAFYCAPFNYSLIVTKILKLYHWFVEECLINISCLLQMTYILYIVLEGGLYNLHYFVWRIAVISNSIIKRHFISRNSECLFKVEDFWNKLWHNSDWCLFSSQRDWEASNSSIIFFSCLHTKEMEWDIYVYNHYHPRKPLSWCLYNCRASLRCWNYRNVEVQRGISGNESRIGFSV